MKRIQAKRWFFIGIFGFIFYAGCREQMASESEKATADDYSLITGIWKSTETDWEIRISSEGKVESAVIPLAAVEVRPNFITRFEMEDGQYSTYRAGDFTAIYNPLDRELEVGIKIEDVNVVLYEDRLAGHIDYGLVGPVSEDGSTWTADYLEIFDFGPTATMDPNVDNPQIIFKKIVE